MTDRLSAEEIENIFERVTCGLGDISIDEMTALKDMALASLRQGEPAKPIGHTHKEESGMNSVWLNMAGHELPDGAPVFAAPPVAGHLPLNIALDAHQEPIHEDLPGKRIAKACREQASEPAAPKEALQDAAGLLREARQAMYDLTYGDTKDESWWTAPMRRAKKVIERIDQSLKGRGG